MLTQLDLSGLGVPQSLARREDGLLALATFEDVYLIQPAKLLLPAAGGSGALAG